MTKQIYATVVAGRKRRVYSWYYTFGPAPRDLQSLSDPSYSTTFASRDGRTKTWSASQTENKRALIESYITTADGVDIPYKLEGSPDPEAPLIVLINSILSDWGIWDEFLDGFFAEPKNQKYRVLRYRPRGRVSDPGSRPVTIDVLSEDTITLLDALRVPKAAAVFGVSLGGATALNVALKYPSRVNAFISSDTNSFTPASNPPAWRERIALAESDTSAPTDSTGGRLVGEKLAEATARRWFVPGSYDGGVRQARAEKVKQYVLNNHFEGFKRSVLALFDYDVREVMKTGTVRGIFTVGAGDGMLPEGMKKMAADYGSSGTELAVIDDAGHLPMAEQPERYVAIVNKFLHG
jgi:pimeloyl-ACP methyl ester carboxylesterase